MAEPKCKTCRRAGEKLFLKGDRCYSPKCPLIRRPYPPGPKGKRRRGRPSEYAHQLKEKQKLKKLYGLRETQFKNYVLKAIRNRGKVEDTSNFLIKMLESRLDNVVYRLGFAASRSKCRQLVSHGYFLVNGQPVKTPSYQLDIGDVVSVRPHKKDKTIIKEEAQRFLKKHEAPDWLKVNKDELKGEVVGEPTQENIAVPVEISSIFEFYSR